MWYFLLYHFYFVKIDNTRHTNPTFLFFFSTLLIFKIILLASFRNLHYEASFFWIRYFYHITNCHLEEKYLLLAFTFLKTTSVFIFQQVILQEHSILLTLFLKGLL